MVVKDRASGMTHQEMEKRLLPLGRRASGSERGESVRGNRGRGAKDLIAFGDVVFESIKDQRLSMLKLTARGGYELFADRRAEPADRDRLGIMRGNGTAVTVYCGRRYGFRGMTHCDTPSVKISSFGTSWQTPYVR